MSGLASLYNVPSTETEFSSWAFAHMAHHRDINRRIRELSGLMIPEYPLDPFDPHYPADWAFQHQLMHNRMDAILGIRGYNLLSPDFKDSGARASWIYLNSDEHRQASNILQLD